MESTILQGSLLSVCPLRIPPASLPIQSSIISGGRTTMFSQSGSLHCSPPAVTVAWQGKKLVQHVSRSKKKEKESKSALSLKYHPSVGEPPTPSGVRQNVCKMNSVTLWFRLLQMQLADVHWMPQKVIHVKQWWSIIWDALEISNHCRTCSTRLQKGTSI